MLEIEAGDLARTLGSVGIEPGDVLLMHSSLASVGRIRGLPIGDTPRAIVSEVLELLSSAGTLVVPTFDFGFCKGETYDVSATPSSRMGVLSECARLWPGAVRSSHPLQSLAAIGPMAAELAKPDRDSGYAEEGPFGQLVRMGAKVALVGVSFQAASIIHYAEERVGVPYRYWKRFSGRYVDRTGVASERRYSMYVRDLEIDPKLDISPLEHELLRTGELTVTTLGNAKIRVATGSAIVQRCSELLRCDPWLLVSNRPEHSDRLPPEVVHDPAWGSCE